MPSSAPTVLYALSLHDALPIFPPSPAHRQHQLLAVPVALAPDHAGPVHPGRPAPGRRDDHPVPAGRPGRVPVAGGGPRDGDSPARSEEHTSELQSRVEVVCRLRPPLSSTLFPYTTLFRSSRPVQLIGNISYSLYLWHWPLIMLAPFILGDLLQAGEMTTPYLLAVLGVSLLLVEDRGMAIAPLDRKSTRLNSSHEWKSYAVFGPHCPLRSFPTRRSSDLPAQSSS